MSTFPQRVQANILPRSLSGTLPEAFLEWIFTEQTVDHEHATETCQMCEQEDLRYHFEILNVHTHHRLWVGSQCILRFNVSVFDGNRRLSSVEAKKKMDSLLKKLRLESCFRALDALAKSEPNDILTNALTFYRTHKYLTPKQAFVVLWRLQKNHIDHSPSFFKISLKKDRYKADLAAMELSRVHVIWASLSSAQRDIATSLGHRPPTGS